MNCSLCTNPAPIFTLCEYHQAQLGIRIRREDHRRGRRGSDHPKKPGTLPPIPDRPPLPPGLHTVELPEWAIHAVRDAYMHPAASLRSVAEEIGVSFTVVQRIIRSVPGDPVERRTIRLLEGWAQREEGGCGTPHETIRTMTPTLKQHLRRFMDGEHEGVDDLALRGIIHLDIHEQWVLSAHGRRVWELVKSVV